MVQLTLKEDQVINAIGWIGNLILAACAAPLAYESIKAKHSRGVNVIFLWMWLVGELFALIFHLSVLATWPQIVNYVFNIICISIILKFKYKPKDKNGKINFDNTQCGEPRCILCESEQQGSDELRNSQVNQVLHKAQALEHPRASVYDSGDYN